MKTDHNSNKAELHTPASWAARMSILAMTSEEKVRESVVGMRDSVAEHVCHGVGVGRCHKII